MVTLNHNILDSSFQSDATANYHLSILAGGDSFSYVITDESRRVLGLRVYGKQSSDKSVAQFLQRVVPNDGLLGHSYRSVRLGWYSPKFTLVPTVLWDEAQAETYLRSVVRLHNNERVQSHALPVAEGLHIAYTSDKTALQYLQTRFPQARLQHAFSGALVHWLNRLPSEDDLVAAAHIHADSWTITILHKHKLLYHNTFRYKTASDCLYYTLAVFKYLNLNPQKHRLYLSGELLEESEIYQLLYKYIQTLTFAERPVAYHYSEGFSQQVPAHFYLELLTLQLCE